MSAYNVWTVRAVQLARIRAFQWAVDEVRTLPLTLPKGNSKNEFVVFVNKILFQSNKVRYKVFVWKHPAANL